LAHFGATRRESGGAVRVAVIHPWFPQYRLALFHAIRTFAEQEGITVDIFYGQTPPEWRGRSDSISDSVAEELPTRFFHLGNKSISAKSLTSIRQGDYDLVIVEQAVRNVETYKLLAARRPRVAFWGHGKTYTEQTSKPQEALKQFLTRRGRWFFAYTEGGRDAVVANGFPSDRVSVVMNAVDTRTLRADFDSLTREESASLLGIEAPGPCLLYIGALDQSKRIDFLIETAIKVHESVADVQLIIAGEGAQREQIESFSLQHPWVRYVGRLEGRLKAAAFRLAEAVVIPGRVGLVAVDAIACERPVITTDWPLHAPEFEYLIDGENAMVAVDSVADYARAVVTYLQDPNGSVQDSARSATVRRQLSVEQAAMNFAQGLKNLGKREGLL